MGSEGTIRRPFCNNCAKPSRICLCNRLKSPPLNNSIGVTILQHNLEKNHPLNSSRVAKLGLKNLCVVPVTDVLFQAKFLIEPGKDQILNERLDFGTDLEGFSSSSFVVDQFESEGFAESEEKFDLAQTVPSVSRDCDQVLNERSDFCTDLKGFSSRSFVVDQFQSERFAESEEKFDLAQTISSVSRAYDQVLDERSDFCTDLEGFSSRSFVVDQFESERLAESEEKFDLAQTISSVSKAYDHALDERSNFSSRHHAICTDLQALTPSSFVVDQFQPKRLAESEEKFDLSQITSNFSKYTVTYSSKCIMVVMEKGAKPDIGWILNNPVGRAVVSNGFIVRKFQRKKLSQNSEEFKDFEEFNLVIPPGSMLLFPSSNAIGIEEVDHEVKHLIVLDGTWAKAKRMYYENPWLKLLPHLKLDQCNESLYSDVRHQPKAGYLSTVESIVCALKGLGDDNKVLDEILEVFESMIRDQKCCKDEKFKSMSKS